MEKSTEAGVTWTRHGFNAEVTPQDLVDSYLAGFQSCVEKGRVSGLMCAYNSINGVPSCADYWLQQTVARESWNFVSRSASKTSFGTRVLRDAVVIRGIRRVESPDGSLDFRMDTSRRTATPTPTTTGTKLPPSRRWQRSCVLAQTTTAGRL